MKVQAQSFVEPPLESNQQQAPQTIQGCLWTFKAIWVLSSFRLVLEGRTGKSLPDWSRLDNQKKPQQTVLPCQMLKVTH